MSTYQVFLGAPSLNAIDNNNTLEYQWEIISSQSQSDVAHEPFPTLSDLPTIETLDDASRRVSLIYQNVIFNDEDDDDSWEQGEQSEEIEKEQSKLAGTGKWTACCLNRILNPACSPDQTTTITWPPTIEQNPLERSRSRSSFAQSSFLNTPSRSYVGSQFRTRDTQGTQSFNYSDASSIACFPTFHFNLHALVSITQLVKQKIVGTIKVSTLSAVLEVEGPDTVRIKSGKDAGKEVAVLRLILGDEGGSISKLIAWREVAECWGGQQSTAAVKRGDIVLIESMCFMPLTYHFYSLFLYSDVTIAFDPKSSPIITASPFLKSSLTICYRTMPYVKSDSRLRPDLRLGQGDAAVRKVAAVVAWFQRLTGLDKC